MTGEINLHKKAGGLTAGLRTLLIKTSPLVLMAAALILGQTPYLSNIFDWQLVFFHEISHGLAALLSGGDIVEIELNFDGSGVCFTRGGWPFLISLAGYAGAVAFGVFIYLLAGFLPREFVLAALTALVALFTAAGSFYARSFSTAVIIFVLTLMQAAAVKFRNRLSPRLFLKLTGLYLVLASISALLNLWRANAEGSDAARLAALTHLPEGLWLSLWLALAVAALVAIWKLERREAARRIELGPATP